MKLNKKHNAVVAGVDVDVDVGFSGLACGIRLQVAGTHIQLKKGASIGGTLHQSDYPRSVYRIILSAM